MFQSNRVRTIGSSALLFVFCAVACGDVLITYESDIDRDASTPDVIDLFPDEIATITISLTPLAGETEFGGAGFLFEGVAGAGGVANGILRISNFRWTDALQDPGIWFVDNSLPRPWTLLFFPGAQPLPDILATVKVLATEAGVVVQNTGPIIGGPGGPYPLAEGSDSFTVRGVPEPATAGLLIVGMMLLARRRTVGRVSPAVRA